MGLSQQRCALGCQRRRQLRAAGAEQGLLDIGRTVQVGVEAAIEEGHPVQARPSREQLLGHRHAVVVGDQSAPLHPEQLPDLLDEVGSNRE